MNKLEEREQKIRTEKATLRAKMEAKKHKEFYDACKRNKIELKQLDEVPFYALFMAACTMIPMPGGDGKQPTVFGYVTGQQVFKDTLAKTGIMLPPVDGAPGRAQ